MDIKKRDNEIGRKMLSGVSWAFAERIASQSVSTVITIVLARLLEPSHYGLIAIVTIFIAFCDVFVTEGMGKALVQKKNADSLDFNSMFYANFGLSVILYVVLFISAPAIERFYQMDTLTEVIRVMGLRVLLTAINTIQQAYVQKSMEFRKFFYATFAGTLASAVVGIMMAYMGMGVWALVFQYLSNSAINTIIMHFVCGWSPKLEFSFTRIKVMLPFSVRVLMQGVVYTIENNFRSLIIGKKFGADDLAFFNKGQQFPQLIITNINTAISKVMFSAVSLEQDDKVSSKYIVRRSVSMGMYILCPVMIGFMAIAKTFVVVILTAKWLPCVPFLQILCLAYLTRPFETTCSQAIMGMGRSDITLRNMLIINGISVVLVLVAVFGFESILLIAVGNIVSALLSVGLYGYHIQKLLDYRFKEQLRDYLPSMILSIAMACGVYAIQYLPVQEMGLLVLQIVLGGCIYIAGSVITKNENYMYIWNFVKHKIFGRQKQRDK